MKIVFDSEKEFRGLACMLVDNYCPKELNLNNFERDRCRIENCYDCWIEALKSISEVKEKTDENHI